jgi:hypothetical protein
LSKLGEVEPLAAMRFRSDGEDPSRGGSFDSFEQQIRQQEWSKMVDCESQLEAVG